MKFDGAFVNAEVGGDLLVHFAADHMGENLLFPVGQSRQAAAQFGKAFVRGRSRAFSCQRALDRREQRLGRRHLGEKIFGAPPHGMDRGRNVGLPGKKDIGMVMPAPMIISCNSKPFTPGMLRSSSTTPRASWTDGPEEFFCRRKGASLIARRLQQALRRSRKENRRQPGKWGWRTSLHEFTCRRSRLEAIGGEGNVEGGT